MAVISHDEILLEVVTMVMMKTRVKSERLQVRTIVQLFSISFLFKNYETHNTTELRISNEVLLT